MFLSPPPEDDAVRRLYDDARADDGYIANLARLWAWRPDVLEAFNGSRATLSGATTLSAGEIAILNAATASRLGDAYCSIAWGTRLAGQSDPPSAAALLRGEEISGFTGRQRALARWARVVVDDPSATTQADVDELRHAGLSEREIVEATLFVAFRLAFSTFNGALGALPDRELAAEAPAEILASVTYGRPVDGATA